MDFKWYPDPKMLSSKECSTRIKLWMITDTFKNDICEIYAQNSLSIELVAVRIRNNTRLCAGVLEEMVYLEVSIKSHLGKFHPVNKTSFWLLRQLTVVSLLVETSTDFIVRRHDTIHILTPDYICLVGQLLWDCSM